MFKTIRTWISNFTQEINERKVQRLRDEAAQNIVMRKIKCTRQVSGEDIPCEGYGIFVCGNLVAESAKADTAFFGKLFELREIYFEIRNNPSAYTLL